MSAFSLPFPYSRRAPAPLLRRPTTTICSTDHKAKATLLARYQGTFKTLPEGLVEVGLLVRVPSSEGGNVQEVVGSGYQRQVVQFRPMRGGVSQRNTQPVEFEFGASAQDAPVCIGVFVANQLLFYGRLEALPGSPQVDDDVITIKLGAESILLAFRRES